MADEPLGERTEKPTPKKRMDALKKGEVPRSQEVTSAFLLLAGAAALSSGGAKLAQAVTEVFGYSVAKITALPTGVAGTTAYMQQLGWKLMAGMAPVLLTLAGTALAVTAIQARGVLSVDPLKPKWSRMDPVKKIPQIWGWKAIHELAKNLFKLLLIGSVVFIAVGPAATEFPALGQKSPFALLATVQEYAVRILLSAGLAYLILAIADYAFQIWQHEKQLKMSREEIKKEMKESEGDQVIKVRRRTLGRQLARRRMLLAVSDADVVITNPTHIAVALKYDPTESDAPIVLAMGERKVAQRIKELAQEKDIPTVENKPLARALFATAKVGFPIPVELFVAVAEILAWVYRQASYQPETRVTAGLGVEA